jgi:hypothetical protein
MFQTTILTLTLVFLSTLLSPPAQANAARSGRAPAVENEAQDVEEIAVGMSSAVTLTNDETVIDGGENAPLKDDLEEFRKSEQALLRALIETENAEN